MDSSILSTCAFPPIALWCINIYYYCTCFVIAPNSCGSVANWPQLFTSAKLVGLGCLSHDATRARAKLIIPCYSRLSTNVRLPLPTISCTRSLSTLTGVSEFTLPQFCLIRNTVMSKKEDNPVEEPQLEDEEGEESDEYDVEVMTILISD